MFFPTAEGYYDYKKDQYIYQYKDHFGNVMVSFGRNSAGALEIVDANDYYPFGMNHLKTGNAFYGQGSYKNYKYNGKELQETGMYDYGARMYMPDLGRWGVVDPAAELGRRFSPYNYAFNNPILFIDLDGMWPWPTWGQVKSFASGVGRGAWNTAKGIVSTGAKYNPVTMSYAAMSDTYHAGKKIHGAYKQGGAKAATKEAGNILYESSGAKAIVQTAKGVAKGDPEAIGAAAVIVASGKALSKAGGAKASTESVTVAESTNYSKLLNPTSEFDPVKTLYRGTTGSESKSSALFLTDNAEVAGTYTKNGGQVMQYDLSNSGLYKLQYTGEVDIYKGINQGSNVVSTEYKFIGKDLVQAVNEKGKPHNP